MDGGQFTPMGLRLMRIMSCRVCCVTGNLSLRDQCLNIDSQLYLQRQITLLSVCLKIDLLKDGSYVTASIF